ncbi:MAG: 50S ribosomal protein L4 [Patescibacteria group bacterium]|jgi:large subunit ribosomal protein L4
MPKQTSSSSKQVSAATSVATVVKLEAAEFTGTKIDLPVLGQMIVDLQHNQHHATANTKTRGEVAGSTKKPWRQKGTGRARVGTKRTPLWRGGGRVFGPSSLRNFQHKLNQKSLRPALSTALAGKAMAGEVFWIDQPYEGGQRTKTVLQFLQGSLDPQSNLIIIAAADPALQRASRNLGYVKVRSAQQVNLLDVATHRRIIILGEARPALISRLS